MPFDGFKTSAISSADDDLPERSSWSHRNDGLRSTTPANETTSQREPRIDVGMLPAGARAPDNATTDTRGLELARKLSAVSKVLSQHRVVQLCGSTLANESHQLLMASGLDVVSARSCRGTRCS